MPQQPFPVMSLYSSGGERKYLNADERTRFIAQAQQCVPEVATFCLILAYTGCRISEALNLTSAAVQHEVQVVSFMTLKRRGLLHVREVPVPEEFLLLLADTFSHLKSSSLLWPWGRTFAWEQVKRIMQEADIAGLHASPKGLRHGFGVHAVQSGVPINMVQKWLGHAQISTTAIYTDAMGPEERSIAGRMW